MKNNNIFVRMSVVCTIIMTVALLGAGMVEEMTVRFAISLGMPVKVSFYAESRESKNGKYYTTLRCTNIMHLGAASNVSPVAGENPPTSNATPYSWNQTSNTEPTQNQKAKEVPHENDLSWDNDEVPF